jgi:hypothetical protein
MVRINVTCVGIVKNSIVVSSTDGKTYSRRSDGVQMEKRAQRLDFTRSNDFSTCSHGAKVLCGHV